jgi:RNA polymerase II subunit A-like phosphatase
VNGSSTPATPTSSVAFPGDPSPEEEVDSTFMQIKEQGRILEAQMEDRPLAKEQEKLNDGSATGSNASVSGKDDRAKEGDASGSGSGSESELEDDDELELRALLTNDDNELERVEAVLMEVHKRFFDAYDTAKEMGLAHGQNGQNQNQNGDIQQSQNRRIDYDVTVSCGRFDHSYLLGGRIGGKIGSF